MSKKILTPIGDNILVKTYKENQKEEKTKSGIIVLKEETSEIVNKGVVIEKGEGRLLNNGTYAPLKVKKGDEIIFNSFAGTTIIHEEEEYLILKANDVLAIIN